MKLYLISQDEEHGYETYDSAVIAAENEMAARCIHPSGDKDIRANINADVWERHQDQYGVAAQFSRQPNKSWQTIAPVQNSWVSQPSRVSVTLIGTAVDGTSAGVICASFNAG